MCLVVGAVLAGDLGYALYPNIKYCFLVIGFLDLVDIVFIKLFVEQICLAVPEVSRLSHRNDTDKLLAPTPAKLCCVFVCETLRNGVVP
jgi:hypothetical protein